MVSNEVWMGSGTSVTMAYESDLFLGYMNPGPTMGLTGTKEANYVRFSVGYEHDRRNWQHDTKMFSDYYELVPDLYTGCIAEFYWTTDDSVNPTLRMTSRVVGNDKSGLYFAGQLLDYPTSLYNGDGASSEYPRGYIILKGRGTTIPAPISLRNLADVSISVGDLTDADANISTSLLSKGDKLYNENGAFLGEVQSNNGTAINFRADTNSNMNGTTNSINGYGNIQQFTCDTSLTGIVQAGDTISTNVKAGDVITMSSDGKNILLTPTAYWTDSFFANVTDTQAQITLTNTYSAIVANGPNSSNFTGGLSVGMAVTGTHVQGGTTIASIDSDTEITLSQAISGGTGNVSITATITTGSDIYKGESALVAATSLQTPHIRTLSDNWIGLTNSVTPPSLEVEMKQVNLALAGTRNYTYQYKGIETAGEANIDVNLNHGSWLYYALGNLNSVTLGGSTTDENSTSAFRVAANANTSKHTVWAGYSGLDNDDYNTDGHDTLNGKFHRVLKNSQTICPPMMPFNGARQITEPNVSNGIANNLITYTFSERNDATLPSFTLEMTQEKGSNLGSIPMVDTNTYSQTVYSQLYPGCMVNSMSFTANENEEVKATLGLNVKRVFENPPNYVSKAYDATNNDTLEFKKLFNFGQTTGLDTDVSEERHSLIEPFYFSDGTISLFGADFMKVSSMSLTINNAITDKRYIGQYNKQIKDAVPAQRTYELSMQALVTDRRLFDELRRQSPHRFNLQDTDTTSNAIIQLLFTKDNGERIRLQFDDYMIGANTWPIPDDKGVITVDFSIMPIRIGTMDAISSWIMQK